MLRMVDHLHIKQNNQKKKTSRRPEQPPKPPKNPNGTQPPKTPRPPVPALNAEVTIPLKYLSTFRRFLNLPLINCETELDLWSTKDCVLIEHLDNITGVHFVIISTKLYIPLVALSINDNVKLLKNIKQRFKRTILWNKYRLDIKTQPKKLI